MRIGIFSDVHANIDALEAVVARLRAEGVDDLVCLGDTVGYGPEPEACCELVREVASHCVVGNHDAAVAGRMDYSYYYEAARNALDLHRELISPQSLEWLQGLPYTVDYAPGEVLLSHGSPLDVEEFDYVFTPMHASTLLPMTDELPRLTVIGHSHLVRGFALDAPRDRVRQVLTETFPLRDELRYIVSAGSVGQPRDGDTRAGCGIYDTQERRFEVHRVTYDLDRALSRFETQPRLARAFCDRLRLGL